ncbi:uncharacterized protein LOC134542678 isoform X2 [Bacillus rossius redtenbacheri]|uniref:uncharacterized protein LOC134542678 isoform X2 n=1 Tax=Bacillus rossius redtenbacheri TaxID=93214 RepID=UPI002FDD18CE
MAAPVAADRPNCSCSNIAIMQLFHELKQRFPAVPDRVVSECIRKNAHDRPSCELILSRENQTYLLHSYPASLKMCTAASEPSSPLALGFGEDFPVRLDDPGARNPHLCCDRFSYLDQLRTYLDRDMLAQVDDEAVRWDELAASRAYHRHPHGASNQRLFGSDEPGSVPAMPEHLGRYCSAIPGSALDQPESRPSRCDGPFGEDFHVNVNCSLQQSPEGSSLQVTSSAQPRPRARTSMELQPSPHYSSLDGRPQGSAPRSYTSVNLTLRAPSSEPQPPIDIQSAGSSLTYSTSSFDPRQGYQSQLQIRIGPGSSGSVTAVRTRTRDPASPPRAYSLARSGSLSDVNSALSRISESSEDSVSEEEEASVSALGAEGLDPGARELLLQQVQRKSRLQRELLKERQKLRKMHREVQSMRRDLQHRELLKKRSASHALPVVTSVLQQVQQLRADIQWLQEECKLMAHEVDDTDNTGRVAERAAPHWTCSACTYKNHPLLDKCEQCDMPHIELAGGETQDIHIHVTHHNFPTRRVIHSWVV